MSDYHVTDFSHLVGAIGAPEAPAPARRLALYLAAVVEAGTAASTGEVIATPLPCRRRPARRPCPGRLVVRRLDIPSRIDWRCPSCGDAGEVTGWEGSFWDFTSKRFATYDDEEAEVVRCILPEDEYRILKEHVLTSDWSLDRLVASARLGSRGVILEGPAVDVDELLGCVAFEANHTDNRRHRELLDRLSDRLWEALEV